MTSDYPSNVGPQQARPGEQTWRPNPEYRSHMEDFMDFISQQSVDPCAFDDYFELWKWSVTDLSEFWDALRRYFDVRGDNFYGPALADERMPGANWYPSAKLNLAENVLKPAFDSDQKDKPAIIDITEQNEITHISWFLLATWADTVAIRLTELGVGAGDRVVAVLPNIPEALVGLLASASIGAIWSICSPDLAADAVVGRLAQLEPKILVGTSGYEFNGKELDRRRYLHEISARLPTVTDVLIVDGLECCSVEDDLPQLNTFDGEVAQHGGKWDSFPPMPVNTDGISQPSYARLPFDHPLWVLFSSGTTGAPKGIVHGHGGILLESLKNIGLAHDMGPSDIYYVSANTSWMVWNTLISNLAAGATVVTYSGSPTFGGAARQFEVIEMTGASMFSVGAAYLSLVEKSGIVPREQYSLHSLRSILSTGSPLPSSTWRWVHAAVGADVHLGSDSGGTDICSGFVGSNPITPVHLGESQGPLLGVAVQAWNAEGRPVKGEVGEMVITRPMPSMPLYLWGDSGFERYRSSYFSTFPEVWAQGDWVTETDRHGFIVHGRSDATLNRQGVRLGSGDIYAAIQDLNAIEDSLVIGIEGDNGEYWMPLFVQLAEGCALDDDLRLDLTKSVRARASARHVPDEIIVCPAVPLTHAGKRIEIPIKKLFSGRPVDVSAVRNTLRNPDALDWFVRRAQEHGRKY